MANQAQTKNPYDQVFDFIFNVQKKKVNKPFPKPRPDEDGEYLSALVEIGTQPAIYPLEGSLDLINNYISKETAIDFGGGVRAGLGSGVFSDPTAYAKKEVSKARAKENFARVGGYLHHGIDGALVSLFAKRNGVSSKSAVNMGILFSDVEKLKEVKKTKQWAVFGIDDEEDLEKAEERVQNDAIRIFVDSLVRNDPRLSKDMLLDTIRSGQKIESREERFRNTVERLKYGGLSDVKERTKVAEKIWGKGSDLGVYRNEKDAVAEILKGVDFKGDGERRQFDKGIHRIVDRDLQSDEDKRRQKNEIYKTLKNDYKLNAKDASLATLRLTQEIPTKNSRVDIAEKALYSSLVGEVMGSAIQNEDYDTVSRAKDAIKGVLENHSGETSMGMRVARARILYNWAKDAEGLSQKLFNGEWERFGNSDLNFTQIVKSESVYDDTGKKIGQFTVPAKTTIGALLGNFYYFHPKNFIKGIFLDGDLLLKMASEWDPQKKKYAINKRNPAYFFYQARLGNVLSAITKPVNILSQKILGIINPLASGLKKFIKNFLVRMLGAAGVGGMIVNFLMRIFGDEIAKAVAQVTIVIMMGLLGILFVLLESTGIFYSEDITKIFSERNVKSSESSMMESSLENEIFTDEDFPLKP